MSNEIVYTHRTKHGKKARILATDAIFGNFPVVALVLDDNGVERIHTYTADLHHNTNGDSEMDLIEYSPWMEVAVDTPVLVGDSTGEVPRRRYFAFFKDGKVHTWADGFTSWTIDEWVSGDGRVVAWDHAVIANQNK